MRTSSAVLGVWLSVCSLAGAQQSRYLTGTLVEISQGETSSSSSAIIVPPQMGGGSIPFTITSRSYLIEVRLPDMVCIGVAANPMSDLVVGDSIGVRFDGEHRTMWVRRPNGKEYKTTVLRRTRTARAAPEAATSPALFAAAPPGPAPAPLAASAAPAAPAPAPPPPPSHGSAPLTGRARVGQLVAASGLTAREVDGEFWVMLINRPSGGVSPIAAFYSDRDGGMVSIIALVAENAEWPLSSKLNDQILRWNARTSKFKAYVDEDHRYKVRIDEALRFVDEALFTVMAQRAFDVASEVRAELAPLLAGRPTGWVDPAGGGAVHHTRECQLLQGKGVHRVLEDLPGSRPCTVCRR